jgi:hypothetical protein
LVISQVLQFLAPGAAKLLFFSGSCLETEVSEQLLLNVQHQQIDGVTDL